MSNLDNDGDSDSTTEIVTVINLPPIAEFTYSPTKPKKGEDVEFTDDSVDPEGKRTGTPLLSDPPAVETCTLQADVGQPVL